MKLQWFLVAIAVFLPGILKVHGDGPKHHRQRPNDKKPHGPFIVPALQKEQRAIPVHIPDGPPIALLMPAQRIPPPPHSLMDGYWLPPYHPFR